MCKRGVRSRLGLMVLGALIAGPAFADPCEGRLPRREGTEFGGVVRYVGDGDSLCVGASEEPGAWIEVRLADFDAPELGTPPGKQAKTIAEEVLKNEPISCTVVRGRSGRTTSFDRVFALCRVDGRAVGDLMKEAGAPIGGN